MVLEESNTILNPSLAFWETGWRFGKRVRRRIHWCIQLAFLVATATESDFRRGGPRWVQSESSLSSLCDTTRVLIHFQIQFSPRVNCVLNSTCAMLLFLMGPMWLGLASDYWSSSLTIPLHSLCQDRFNGPLAHMAHAPISFFPIFPYSNHLSQFYYFYCFLLFSSYFHLDFNSFFFYILILILDWDFSHFFTMLEIKMH